MDYMKFVNYHREMNGKAAHGSCPGYTPVVCSCSYATPMYSSSPADVW